LFEPIHITILSYSCIDIPRTFSCIIRVFYSFVLLTVHLCAIDTRFNKCNLLYLQMYGSASSTMAMVILFIVSTFFVHINRMLNAGFFVQKN